MGTHNESDKKNGNHTSACLSALSIRIRSTSKPTQDYTRTVFWFCCFKTAESTKYLSSSLVSSPLPVAKLAAPDPRRPSPSGRVIEDPFQIADELEVSVEVVCHWGILKRCKWELRYGKPKHEGILKGQIKTGILKPGNVTDISLCYE